MHLSTIIVVTLTLTQVFTFWDVGHMLTANIAELRLQRDAPETLEKFRNLVESINFLCDNKTQTLIESAVWPDDLKNTKYNMGLWDSWHFGDTPYVVDTVSPSINYTEAVMSSIHTVQTAAKVLKINVNKNTVQRALYARYLIHLAGDIHQPLHSVALFNKSYPKGDIGGNREKVILLNGTERNFHQFWDSGAFLIQNDSWNFIRPMNHQNRTLLKQVAQSYIREFGDDVQEQGRIIDPIVWAQESFIIAQNITYPHIMRTNRIDEQYSDLTFRTLRRQIVKAGFRLANFVIDVYKDSNSKTTLEKSQKAPQSHRDHKFTFMEKAKDIVKKLFQTKLALHPDCNDPANNIVSEQA